TNREKMAIRNPEDGGKPASTFYKVVERFDGFAYILCKPLTGRTHQIRIHLAHIAHPILPDKAYSGRDRIVLADLLGPGAVDGDQVLLERQALHAHTLRLTHPLTGQPLEFVAPLPEDMRRTLAVLRANRTCGS